MAVRAQISQIVHNNLRFLITDRPSDAIVDEYVASLKKNNVSALVRVCEPSYDTSKIIQASIKVFDWGFQDGAPPPDEVVTKWLDLCEETFSPTNETFIAVHCVAGLGRAPVLVALSLIESGMSSEEAVMFIRKKRHGAINHKQLLFLREYRRRGNGKKKCVIM